MIELLEANVRGLGRNSSKGNQLKWENDGIWYKADYTGYEGLSEYVVSELLKYSTLKENEFIAYTPLQMKYKTNIYNGVCSQDFLKSGWQIITLERLFMSIYGEGLNSLLWNITSHDKRLNFLVSKVEEITGLTGFGAYMNKVLTIDAFFLNEDRHTHNIAVLMNENGEYDYCPIFDNGAGLLSDISLDYPMDMDLYQLIDSVKGKTFSDDLEEQMEISENYFKMNLLFHFTKCDVERILSSDTALFYPLAQRERVKRIVFEQMRRYPYLFE